MPNKTSLLYLLKFVIAVALEEMEKKVCDANEKMVSSKKKLVIESGESVISTIITVCDVYTEVNSETETAF